MDQRKRKRMQSNRESARRSRMRKQKHLDDLVAELAQLRQENNHILTNIDITTQQHMNVESENSVLRAQMVELSHRLQSLNDILTYMNTNNGVFESQDLLPIPVDNYMNNHPWNLMFLNQPIMTSPAMFQYWPSSSRTKDLNWSIFLLSIWAVLWFCFMGFGGKKGLLVIVVISNSSI